MNLRGVPMKFLDRIKQHPAVAEVSVEPEAGGTCYFVYLNKGWEWSEQTSFGCETITEAWNLVKEATNVGVKDAEDIKAIGD